MYFKDGEDKEQSVDFMDVFQRMKLDKLTYSYIKFQPFSDKHPLPRNDEVLNLFTGLAVEHIARLTALRYQDTPARPAPLYIKPADAAPPKDPAPVILP